MPRAVLQHTAGQYTSLIEANVRSKGLIEGVTPGFVGWVQGAYNTDRHLALTQDDRGSGGTSSWSKLFAQCDIKAQDLVSFGGPTANFYPAVTGKIEPRQVPQADVIVEENRVLYGLSGDEFSALLIICGFSVPSLSDSGSCTTFLGSFELANYNAFSQQAQFNPHQGCRYILGTEKERYQSLVPVRRCIDCALGILRTPLRGKRCIIIIPQEADSELAHWRTLPSMKQLNSIRYNLEQLVSISGGDIIRYNLNMEEGSAYDMATMSNIMLSANIAEPERRSCLLASHALASLQPWPVLPVLQIYFVQAFLPLIRPFIGGPQETVRLLQEKLLLDPKLNPISGWQNIEEQARGLDQIGDIRVDFFSESSSISRLYFMSMLFVFDIQKVNLKAVRLTLAATAAWERYIHDLDEKPTKEIFIKNMMTHLNSGRFLAAEHSWAVTVYATFVWGWLNNYITIDNNIKNRFRRRVFLV